MLTIKQFKGLVNAELVKQCGLTMDCLVDFDLYNYYDPDLNDKEAREIATEAAHDLLLEEGFPLEEMV